MHVLVNCCSASAGGGITYLVNLLEYLRDRPGDDVKVSVLVPRAFDVGRELPPHVEILRPPRTFDSAYARYAWEVRAIPKLVLRGKLDIVVAAGNFCVPRCPVPQVLLNRNPLYFSREFARDLLRRRRLKDLVELWGRRRLAIKSIGWATVNVFPTAAFADTVARSAGARDLRGRVIHHGFDPHKFRALPSGNGSRPRLLPDDPQIHTILFVSHYNYFRNFETLIRAIPHLRELLPSRFRVVLTTRLVEGSRHGDYDATACARLIDELGVREELVELGAVPYADIHRLYAAADLFVFPSYAETFGHPLVEAMSSGVAVVASDTGVHREVCGPAALYFPPFDAGCLARHCASLLRDPDARRRLAREGECMAERFSWQRHFEALWTLAASTAKGNA